MAGSTSMTVKLKGDMSDLNRKMKGVETKFDGLQKGFKKHGASISTAFTGIGASVGAGLGYAANEAMTFEAGMSRVGALSQATKDEMEKLTSTAMDLGAETSFSAQQASEGMSYLAMAGFEVNDIISAMPGLLNTAAAGQMDLGSTADIVSNILTGFGLKAEETGNVADVLSKAFTSSNVDLGMLGETMKYAAPVAAGLGIGLEEAATAAAFMGDAGIQGSQAGTALAGGLSALMNPVGQTKEAMDQLGWSVIDSKGNFKSMQTIVSELTNKTKDMTKAERTAALTKMFGQEAAKGWLAVIARGPEEFAKYEEGLNNAGGTAQRVADTQMDNLKGALTKLQSAFSSAAISIGTALLPALRTIAEFLKGLVDKFNNLPQSMQAAIAIGAALGAVFMVMAGVLGFLLTGLAGLSAASLAVIAPIAGIILGVTALVAAFIAAYAKIDWFRNMVNTAFSFIKNIIMTALGAVVEFVRSKLTQIQQFWQQNGQMILQAVRNVWSVIAPIIKVAMALVAMIIKGTWTAIKSVISGALNIIMGIIKTFAALFTGNWSALWSGIKQVLKGAWQVIWGIFLLTLGRILKFFGGILGKMLGVLGGWVGKAVGWFKGLGSKAGSAVMKLIEKVKSLFSDMVTAVGKLLAKWKTDAGLKFLQIVDKAKSVFKKIVDVITQPFKDAWSGAKKILEKIKNAFNNLKLKIPKPKIPKISVSMKSKKVGPLSVPYPDFDLSWFKTGGMFNGPSMIGVGEQPGVKEVAMPLSGKHMKPFADAVAAQMPNGNGGGNYRFEIPFYMDRREFARATAEFDAKELEKRKESDLRAKGKQVIR